VAPGAWTVLESAATGTSLSDYTSSIVCTRNGGSGPSGNGPSLQLTLTPADVLACTITNQRKQRATPRRTPGQGLQGLGFGSRAARNRSRGQEH